MTQIRTAALSRRRAPPFTGVVDLEVLQLRMLSPWVRWLYMELRMLSDFSTGYLTTSWAVLEALMDCDGQQAFAPSRQAIRRGVDQLVSIGLAERFATAGEKGRQLFLKVLPIKGMIASAISADRPADRPRKARKPNRHGASSPIDGSEPTDQPTRDSVPVCTSPISPSVDNLPVDAAREKLKQTALELKARRGVRQQPPQGG